MITTNADLETLDPRIRSRLLDDTIIHRVHITAPDYRTPVQAQRDQLSNLSLYRDMTFDNFDTQTGLSPEERQNLERVAAAAQLRRSAAGLVGVTRQLRLRQDPSGRRHCQRTAGTRREVMFVTVPDLLDYLRLTFSPNSNANFDRRFQTVRSVPLLVLDDLGTESATAWAKEKLFQILNHRYVANLPTVITSSSTVDKIDERIRTRLMDRRRCTVFAITAPSYANRTYRR